MRAILKGVPLLLALSIPALSRGQDWKAFNGDDRAQKFSPATQITPQNVKDLTPAWKFHTGDYSLGGKGKIGKTAWSATPIFANNTVYVGTPFFRVFALDPATGKPKWVYNSHSSLQPLTQTLKTRGVTYWQAEKPELGKPCQKRVYLGTMDAKLHALDADTGKLCPDFGKGGILDINQWNRVNPRFPLSVLQPPTVYKDTLVIGWAGKDWTYQAAPPGSVFGVDARTGRLKWTFHSIPDAISRKIGTANVWASMSVDPVAGIVYMPVSSPEPNFYGGDRKGPIPYATSVTAVDIGTGRVIWSRQLVHHDLWDFDTDSAPVLVDIRKDGRVIPGLVEASKQGFLYVLNRLTGEPIYPMVERRVPASDVPGEQASPTQPFVDTPEPTVGDHFPGISAIADAASFGWCSRTYRSLRDDGRFTPPSIRGSISYPAAAGGVEWGGGAVDPRTQTYVVNSSNVVGIYTLIPRAQYEAARRKLGPRAGAPQEGAPYAARYSVFLNKYGMPCWNPPYGTISSYDLKTGKLLWRKPFGEVQKWGFYMPKSWGSVTLGAPIITASGLIFIGASMDARVRALDIRTGQELWSHLVDTPVVSVPSTFVYRGRQYVVFVAGGNGILDPRVGDEVVAFALPDGNH
jgi:quinoprotein glucose dehydrogenase